ncbi:tRNA(Ile)-lysidine synthase [Tritonibacter multivorans]|uniref:tRNA(Ile)-lysidine synthase n=1 Tax=Tritonibacter multivorans TaxID=928856 RepID=A0A0N7LYR1_9RHOB|nr:tRNA lysidine(34) synthetase TilS [Tritonibacter multivorans]MDA7419491.1 tRNA lysidine(34) synthetase TilS [Tritonibacter multivorans]CUH75569.1 tRNA(Ile)-lysidine synthase [Tritonibacter multivorans]SFC65135.1 tRNA(Ile)-lysidine synthase [Tritonibacter multivorans]
MTPAKDSQPFESLIAAVRSDILRAAPVRLGIAVSGGSDSLALLSLAVEGLAGTGIELFAATVDHRLRAASQEEAAAAKAVCDQLGVPHDTLVWEAGPQGGNLQDQAREARYDLLTRWAKGRDIPMIALGHTADDQAETVLMRLRRASGVTGLAAMRPRRMRNGIMLARPMLDLRRAELQAYLQARDIAWIDDPSNENTKFERVRIRQAMDLLEPLGLTVSTLTAVAENMARSRDALDWYAFTSAQELLQVSPLGVRINQRGFRVLPEEIAFRLLRHSLGWMSGQVYPPRRDPMLAALRAVRHGTSFTLAGCQLVTRKGSTWVTRELNAVAGLSADIGATWDNQLSLHAPSVRQVDAYTDMNQSSARVRAVGHEGLLQFSDWRDLDLPRSVLAASPGVWRGDKLLAAPLAGWSAGYRVEQARSGAEFYSRLLSH